MAMSSAANLDTSGVFAVVPAYNEASALPAVIEDLARFLLRRHIVVVDDASTDATRAVAVDQGVRVLRHPLNRGQGAALATGLAAALQLGARAIVTFDADGQHSADDLPTMLEPVLTGQAEVVLGTRFGQGSAEGVPPLRRLLLKGGILMTRLTSQMRVTDVHNGFRVLSAAAAGQIQIRQNRMAHASEILDEIRKHQLRYVERPVRIRYSQYSLAKGQRNRDALKLAVRLVWNKLAG